MRTIHEKEGGIVTLAAMWLMPNLAHYITIKADESGEHRKSFTLENAQQVWHYYFTRGIVQLVYLALLLVWY